MLSKYKNITRDSFNNGYNWRLLPFRWQFNNLIVFTETSLFLYRLPYWILLKTIYMNCTEACA